MDRGWEHALDRIMGLEVLGDHKGILAVALHTQGECLDALYR
jgi:hypothetical protein